MDKSQIENTNNEIGNVTTFKQNKVLNPTFGKLSSVSNSSQFIIAQNCFKNKSKLIGSIDYRKIMQYLEFEKPYKTILLNIIFVIAYVRLNLINNEKMMINQKGEDMQSVAKHLAYPLHTVLQRGDYHT